MDPQSTIRCRCKFEFPVQEEDRGFTVYCPSCGQECAVPAAEAASDGGGKGGGAARASSNGGAAAEATPRVSVFARQSQHRFEAAVAGEIACLCGERLSVTASDYGTTLYCPSCGAELFVGEQWRSPSAAAARTAASPPDGPPARVSSAAARRSRWAPLAGAVVIAAVAVVGWRLLPSTSPLGGEKGWSGMLQFSGWNTAASPADPAKPASQRPADESNEPEEKAPEDPTAAITLEAIEALLKAEDREGALVDAQVWEQLLIDCGVSAGEPRRRRLAEAIEALIESLAPKTPPPDPAVKPFRALVARLREELSGERLEPARKLHQEAAAMFQAHSAALAPYSRAFLLQQARLKQLEDRLEGVRTMAELLDQALDQAAADKPLEALESRAKALHMAQAAYAISEVEEERLKALAAKLRDPLRLARGGRAVADAKKCHELHDREALDACLQSARLLRPGLPEGQIKPLMATVDKLASQPIARPQPSDFGRAIVARGVYEDALEHYSRGQLTALVASAAELGRLPAPPEAEDYRERAAALAFAALDARLTDVAARTIKSEELVPALEALLQAADKVDAWRGDPRWQALRAAVEAQSSELAAESLAGAQRLASQDRLAEAVTAALAATRFGTAEDRRRAERLREDWQAELDLRASLPAQNEHWGRIERLAAAGKSVDAVRELLVFEQRYPRTPHAADLQALKTKLQPDVDRAIDEILARAASFQKAQQWPSFVKEVKQLETLPVSGDREQACSRLWEEKDRLLALAEGRMEEARRGARLVKDDEIITALETAGEVAMMFPDYPGVADLLARARAAGKARAARLLQKAEAFRRNKLTNSTYQKLLETAARLDPDGESGAKARQALQTSKRT